MPRPSLGQSAALTSFNPRPALRPGDATHDAPKFDRLTFQSAPGLEAGRCERGCMAAKGVQVFQSAPGLEAGRCSRGHALEVASRNVSIRARP